MLAPAKEEWLHSSNALFHNAMLPVTCHEPSFYFWDTATPRSILGAYSEQSDSFATGSFYPTLFSVFFQSFVRF